MVYLLRDRASFLLVEPAFRFSLSILDLPPLAERFPECPEKHLGKLEEHSLFNRPVNLEKQTPFSPFPDLVILPSTSAGHPKDYLDTSRFC